MRFYQDILKPILFRFDPEVIHNFFVFTGEQLGKFSVTRYVVRFLYGYRGRDISKTVDGISYRIPILLAAGFDANGQLTKILPNVAFGGEEIGSVTALPCEGNPKPRLRRCKRSKSIVVYKGLRNRGVDRTIAHLQSLKREPDYVLGISIARTNDHCTAATDEGIQDYYESFKKLNAAGVGDYYTINISCPNAYGGEEFTTPELLERLLTKLKTVPCGKPVYVKMPINLAWEQFDGLLRVIDRFGLNGVVIGNLNKDYQSLAFPDEAPAEFRGGLSGQPCFALSNDLIRRTRAAYGTRFTIIGCGGIFTPEQALEKFAAGTDLIQLITGMIFEGPGLMKDICYSYAEEMDKGEKGA